MDSGNVAAGAPQVLLIRRIKQGDVLVQNRNVLLLKDFAVFAQDLVPIRVVLTVFRHLVDEE